MIYRATAEVAVPVTSGIAIIAIVFLPLLSLQGLEGKLFGPVALTIVFALLASLLLSLTVVPVAASYLLGGHAHGTPRLVRFLEERLPATARLVAGARAQVVYVGAGARCWPRPWRCSCCSASRSCRRWTKATS